MEKTQEATQPPAATTTGTFESGRKELVLKIADVCFEMFSIKELRRPLIVLHELAIAFPDATSSDIQQAIQLAISWRLALRDTRGMAH